MTPFAVKNATPARPARKTESHDPTLGLAPRIVDLVSSGRTLAENGLVEVERVMDVSARLIVNRAAMKTRAEVVPLVEAFRRAVAPEAAA